MSYDRARCTFGKHWVPVEQILFVNGTPICPTCPPGGKRTQLRMTPRNNKYRKRYRDLGGTPIASHVSTIALTCIALPLERTSMRTIKHVEQ